MTTSATSKFARTSTAKAASASATKPSARDTWNASKEERLREARTVDMEELANSTSGSRLLCAWVTTFLTSFGVGYVGTMLAEIACAAVLAFTGSMFLGVLIWLVGVALTMYLGYRAGVAAGVYILAGGPEAHYAAAKSAVSSVADSFGALFRRGTALVA